MALLGEVNGPLLEELAAILSPVLGWSERDAAAEVERTIQLLEKVHGVTAVARSRSSLR
jgi:glycerol-3-phosphate dehydrogenase